MPLVDLLGAMQAEADEELLRLDRASRAEAEQLVEDARAEARALEAALVTAAEPAALGEAERLRAAARLEAARAVRAAREEAFATVLAGVRARLATIRGDDAYPRLLGALLDESRAALPGAVVLRVDSRDMDVAPRLAGPLRVEPVLETWGGLELVADDGRVLRNTLEHRLANAEPELRRRFAAVLDREAGGDVAR